MARKEFGIFDEVYKQVSPKTKKSVYRIRFYWYETPESKIRKFGYSDWCSTKEVARQNAERKINEKFSTPKENNTKLTIEQIAERYVLYMTNHKLSENFRPVSQAVAVSNMKALVLNKDNKGRNIAHIPAELRKKTIDKLTTSDIGNWIHYIITEKSNKTGELLSENTVKKMKKTVRKFILYANTELQCFIDDSDRADALYYKTQMETTLIVDSPKPKDKSYRVLDEPTFRLFMKNKFVPNGVLTNAVMGEYGAPINKQYEYYMLLSMLFYSGARISEVKPLMIEDINWEKNEDVSKKMPNIDQANVRFSKTYSEKCLKSSKEQHRQLNNFMKTNKSNRMIPIYGVYARELFAYIRYLKRIYGRDYKGLIFPGFNNNCMSSNAIQNKIDARTKNLKDLKIDKLSPHDFRASRVTEFLATGLEPDDIYWFFGHNSERLVDGCYKRLRPEKEYATKKEFANKDNFGSEQQQMLITKQIEEQMFLKEN